MKKLIDEWMKAEIHNLKLDNNLKRGRLKINYFFKNLSLKNFIGWDSLLKIRTIWFILHILEIITTLQNLVDEKIRFKYLES